ncbi:MAG: hypothetical protein AB7S49_00325 [Arcobacter sp.]|uniref:hypothetical protein n=1 Tax=unclassified Arcobacter TaxID=2593671 RepID=UPI00022963F9|nr:MULTISPECIES: hypothetical protein [unclassified Arcobacter]MDY3199698.1 hypothetical protein [Arcobacter sp.]BAK74210.1 hypothetical protein ABLL_2335 [Arcobacter sp. L]
MKKSIVLLISLLFIAVISLLILKNLQDTDSYLAEQNAKFSKTQIMFYINNAKDEISNILSKKLDEDILKEYIGVEYPILVQDAKISIKLEEYDKYNINLLNEKDDKKYEYLKDFLQRNEIYDIYTLQAILKENDNIKNNKQLDNLFEKFEKESYNIDISKVKDYIGFMDYDKKEITQNEKEKEILFYELFVNVDYLKQFAKAYYILNKNGGVEYFEFSFK